LYAIHPAGSVVEYAEIGSSASDSLTKSMLTFDKEDAPVTPGALIWICITRLMVQLQCELLLNRDECLNVVIVGRRRRIYVVSKSNQQIVPRRSR
jgi:hypothetical protein